MICIALSQISQTPVELYEIEEGGLKSLPQKSKEAIAFLGIVKIFSSNMAIESKAFQENDSLRSIKYIYNLLDVWGEKRCAFCECEIPQIIQAAHIWPVASIKKQENLSLDEKLEYALDGNNGMWLCENHHKLFDRNLLVVAENGAVKRAKDLVGKDIDFLTKITTSSNIANSLSDEMVSFITKRNIEIEMAQYSNVL